MQQQSAGGRLSKTSMYTIPNLPPTVLETESMVMSNDRLNSSAIDMKSNVDAGKQILPEL